MLNMSSASDPVVPGARLSQWLITPTLNVCVSPRVTLLIFGFKSSSFVFLFCQKYKFPITGFTYLVPNVH